jgi:hypothetical protein
MQALISTPIAAVQLVLQSPTALPTPVPYYLIIKKSESSVLVKNLPPAKDYILTADALDNTNNVLAHGAVAAVLVVKGKTAEVIIYLNSITQPPPITNSSPLIDAIVMSSNPVPVGSQVSLRGTAHDPDLGQTATLSFSWKVSPSCGSVTRTDIVRGTDATNPSASNAVYVAPDTPGNCEITLTVTDVFGLSTSATFTVRVEPSSGSQDAGAPPDADGEDAGVDAEQPVADAGISEDVGEQPGDAWAPDAAVDAATDAMADAEADAVADAAADVAADVAADAVDAASDVADAAADTADAAAIDARIDGTVQLDSGIDGGIDGGIDRGIDGGIDGGWMDGGIDGGIDATHSVTYVEVTVSGPTLAAPITIPLVRQGDGPGSAWGATLSDIPVGSNYVFILRAYDEGHVEVSQGVASNVVIESGKTTVVTINGIAILLGVTSGTSGD